MLQIIMESSLSFSISVWLRDTFVATCTHNEWMIHGWPSWRMLQEADIDGVAQAVAVRQHARETIKAALQKGWQVHVLSVNWSAALIRSVLSGIPSRIDREGADSLTLDAGDQHGVVIHANNLEMQFGISTGPPALSL
jgi:hypothetical protein